MNTSILLVRHCESAGQQPEAPLTDRGREQAEQLAVVLSMRSIEVLVTSPYRRARESAEPLAARIRRDVAVDPRLREWEVPWIPPDQWPQALGAAFAGDRQLPLEIEPVAAARARGVAAVYDSLARDRNEVLVSHGKLMALVLSELQGRDPLEVFVEIRNPHVFELRASPSGIEVSCVWYPA